MTYPDGHRISLWRRGAEVLKSPFVRRRPLRCQEMVELVTLYLEGELDKTTRARFEAHLRGCDGCAASLDGLRVTISTLGTLTEDQLDPVFRDRLLETFAGMAGSW